MIFGIGTDIIEIERIQRAVERNPRILTRLFTTSELSYFEKRNMNIQHIAGGFSAKEAVLKALGTGLSGFEWRDVEVLRSSTGKPIVRLNGKAKEYAMKNNIGNIYISISHSRNYAVATVMAELSEDERLIAFEGSFVQ